MEKAIIYQFLIGINLYHLINNTNLFIIILELVIYIYIYILEMYLKKFTLLISWYIFTSIKNKCIADNHT